MPSTGSLAWSAVLSAPLDERCAWPQPKVDPPYVLAQGDTLHLHLCPVQLDHPGLAFAHRHQLASTLKPCSGRAWSQMVIVQRSLQQCVLLTACCELLCNCPFLHRSTNADCAAVRGFRTRHTADLSAAHHPVTVLHHTHLRQHPLVQWLPGRAVPAEC